MTDFDHLATHRYRVAELDLFWGERFNQPGVGLLVAAAVESDECRWAVPVPLADGERTIGEDSVVEIGVRRPASGMAGFEVGLIVDGAPWPLRETPADMPEFILLQAGQGD